MRLNHFLFALLLIAPILSTAEGNEYQLASFSTDVTIPLGHRCMGVLSVKAERIVDPLLARGFVLVGPEKPIVLVSVDWCEIRNGAYQRWRDVLADTAGTTREHRVPLLACPAAKMREAVSR